MTVEQPSISLSFEIVSVEWVFPLRWLPTDRMIADVLTKESPEAFDLLRACLRSSMYQISPEEGILHMRAAERDRRRAFSQKSIPATSAPAE